MIVAHRGASHDAPENTLAAFELAWEQGADAIEGDFYLTQDQQIVCIHDKDLKRVAKSDLIVSDTTLEQLRKFDVGSWKNDEFAAQRIPTLAEVCATVPAGKKLFLEIKCGIEIIPVLQKQLPQTGLTNDQVIIIAFDADVIAMARQQLPQLKACWLTGFKQQKNSSAPAGIDSANVESDSSNNSQGVPAESSQWKPTAEEVIDQLKIIHASGASCNAHAAVDQHFVQQLRAAGYGFHCWTVNDVATAKRMIELEVESITTDRPQWLREKLAASLKSPDAEPSDK